MSALRRMRATETPIAFKPWVYEIAKNACIDAFRRSKRAEEISYDADDGSERLHLVSKGPTPEAAVDTRMSLDHLRGALRRALGGPPPDPRDARARRPELSPDRRAARDEPAVGGVHPLPRPAAPVRGVRGARLGRALSAHPGHHHRRQRRARGRARRAQDGASRLLLSAVPAGRVRRGLRRRRAHPEAHRAREDRRAAAAAGLPQAPHRRPWRRGERGDVGRRPRRDVGPALDGRSQLRGPRDALGQGTGEGGRRRRRRRRCRGGCPRHRPHRRHPPRRAARRHLQPGDPVARRRQLADHAPGRQRLEVAPAADRRRLRRSRRAVAPARRARAAVRARAAARSLPPRRSAAIP